MAGITHYINTAAPEPANARWPSLINSQPEPFPVLLIGDNRPHQFFFHYDGTIEDFSGNASYTLKVILGDVSLGPIAGTYTLTCGETTKSIPFDADSSTVANALNGLATVQAAGNVAVNGVFPNFLVSWLTAGTQTALTASPIGLIPACSIFVTSIQTGDSTHTQQTVLKLRQTVIVSQSTWTRITSPYNGWSGSLSTTAGEAIALLVSQGLAVANLTQYTTVLTAQIIDGSGNITSYYQTPVIIRESNLDV